MRRNIFKLGLLSAASLTCLSSMAQASNFDIPSGDMEHALRVYMTQSGIQVFVPDQAIKGIRTNGVKGQLSPDEALSRLLSGTGLVIHHEGSAVGIVRADQSQNLEINPIQLAQASPAPRAAVETVTVTSSKLGGADVQSIPISITALSQEQLTATQTAGGPDLIKQVPNMTFTKTNFSGYSIQLRGIGTQAISVTTDPAVAVAFNDIPFIRNHFFEQEFYDVSQVEVLRGPQGTLYGRNATAGVVNLISARPTDQFEAMASGELGNYHQRRFEGMLNIPVVDDRLDIRLAGEWTKRQGYSFNEETGSRIDGRDLWSGRLSIGWKPADDVQTTLIWEHFSEDDDRLRSGKQLCKAAPVPTEVDGVPIGNDAGNFETGRSTYLSQGCQQGSLYSAESFEIPNAFGLPYYTGPSAEHLVLSTVNPYVGGTQSRNLRVINSGLNPSYKAKNDIVELNTDWKVTPQLTLSSQTAFNHDFLWSAEDYNRFTSSPGIFTPPTPDTYSGRVFNADDQFCDPQLGCSDRILAEDLSDEHAWQLSQEFRLVSQFDGPLNFSVGGNYLHYETEENYFVFINTLGALAAAPSNALANIPNPPPWIPGVTDNSFCLNLNGGLAYPDPSKQSSTLQCGYIDPNPISNLNNQGHNYFLSQNPYLLDSYAVFGEGYYNVTSDLKLIVGLRWTNDRKHFVDIPSELLTAGYGYPITGIVNQSWSELTGRGVINWTPKLSFTDQTLIYGSYAHGYKAGGANPPGAVLLESTFGIGDTTNIPDGNPIHPLTFKPEFIDAFELGTKNTLLDGALTLNGGLFYYNYIDYQISEIVDRSAINLNFDAHVKGAEAEATWEPIPGLRLNFSGGWEDTSLAKGSHAVDLMDRTAGNPNWIVVKPFVTQPSNCVLPTYVVAASGNLSNSCVLAYQAGLDPVTYLQFVANPIVSSGGGAPPAGYVGFDPVSPTATNNGAGPAPNNGQGFDKNLSGNKLPNAPPLTASAGVQYTMPLTSDWAGTIRGDYYWQDYSWGRVFNDNPYDRLRGYTNVNLTFIFTNQNGWQVMLYDKNVFNTTAITGTFLNSDDTGLTTNVFLTDPKLIGIRVTKNW